MEKTFKETADEVMRELGPKLALEMNGRQKTHPARFRRFSKREIKEDLLPFLNRIEPIGKRGSDNRRKS